MSEEIHRYLDEEGRSEALPETTRAELDQWDRMLESFRVAAPPTSGAPPWLEDRVMAEIASLPSEPWPLRVWKWLVRPAPIRISPLASALAVGALAALIMIPARSLVSPGPGDPGPIADDTEASVVYVQFVLEAPGARAVSVAGDFSEWEPSYALDDPDGDGVWTGRVPVRPGVHAYMFLVDEDEWRTDPNADRFQDDGFGNRNAVLAVASGT